MLVQELFDFVTDASITEELVERYLSRALAIAAERHRSRAPTATASASTATSHPEHMTREEAATEQEVASRLECVSIDRVENGRREEPNRAGADAAEDELERLAHEDRVFKKVAIPRTLADVPIHVSERDVSAARLLNKLEGPLNANNTSQHQQVYKLTCTGF